VYFQALDDKEQCIGIYYSGELVFDETRFPQDMSGFKTWKYSGSIKESDVDFMWFYNDGKNLSDSCPEELFEELKNKQTKMNAFKKAFEIAKIDFREHCFFDLVPHDFLLEFLETKNKITQHVYENCARPANYEHLVQSKSFL
jgi:hypothetical protein